MFFIFDDNEVPSFDKMIKPLLTALQDLGGTAQIKALDKKTIEIMNPPEDIKRKMHGVDDSRTEIEYRLAWTRTYLKKYGLLKNATRGVWSFTDKFNGNIENIDASYIVKSVRNDNNFKNNVGSSLNKIDSAQAFETLIISMLKEYDADILCEPRDHYCDVILPNGIGEYKDKIYCEIKYISSDSSLYNRVKILIHNYLHNYLLKNIPILGDGKFLLIINVEIPELIKENIISSLSQDFKVKVLIWDYSEWVKYINPDAEYINYLINPRQALIEESLFSKKSNEEKTEQRQENIDLLRSAYSNQDLVLVFGAGISIDSGVPLWDGLIREMLIILIKKKTDSEQLSNEEIDLLCQMAYENIDMSPLAQMRYIKIPFVDDIKEYYNLLQSVLYPEDLRRSTPLLESIAKISAPRRNNRGINSIITYNFDDLIELALKSKDVEYNIVYDENSISTQDKLNIYHVHGYLPHDEDTDIFGDSLIFSEEDYHMVYKDAYSWSNLTQLNTFRDNTCLFIGCSLTDPNLRRLLDIASRNDEKPRHFAIMKKRVVDKKTSKATSNISIFEAYEELDNDLRERYFKSLGLNIIWVTDYQEISSVIDEIYQN